MDKTGYVENVPFPNNFNQTLLQLEYGEGPYLFDKAGKKYVDFFSGIAVNTLGNGNQEIAEIAYKQLKKVGHTTSIFTTEPVVRLTKKLVASGDFEAVHLGNSGTEANEAAMKYARIYSLRTKGPESFKVLSFSKGFHGRTMGALSATAAEKYKAPFKPLMLGFEEGEYNNVEMLEKMLDDKYAAVIVEPFQGEGGLNAMTPEFAAKLCELCKKFDVILIADEVQSGLGRCGSLYCSDLVGLKPDIITLAKPLGGGLPLSATLIPAKVNKLVQRGEHGGTFCGNSVTAAIANYIWDTVTEPAFVKDVAEKSAYLRGELEKISEQFSFLGPVKGLGLLLGITVEDQMVNKLGDIVQKALDNGLIILTAGGNMLRIIPALNISIEQLDEGLAILKKTLEEVK